MFADGHLLLILHEPPSSDHAHRAARLFWRAPDGTWKSNAFGAGVRSLRRHIDEYAQAVERLERLEQEADLADEYQHLLAQILPLLRAARNLHATLQEARELVHDDRDLIICRDQSYVTERAAELLNSDVQSGLQCAIARRAEEQSDNSHRMAVAGHRLNLLAALFLPLATIASVLGMNLAIGFDEKAYAPWPFLVTVSIGVGLGFLLRLSMENNGRASRERVGSSREPY
jgi:Mg2+ and Co2+ transporter CorA